MLEIDIYKQKWGKLSWPTLCWVVLDCGCRRALSLKQTSNQINAAGMIHPKVKSQEMTWWKWKFLQQGTSWLLSLVKLDKDTRNCLEKVKKISHLKPNQLAPSIYIMKELCFFSLDQWEISIHLLWGKCFNIPHHCDPHLNQTKLNGLLPLTIPGVLTNCYRLIVSYTDPVSSRTP